MLSAVYAKVVSRRWGSAFTTFGGNMKNRLVALLLAAFAALGLVAATGGATAGDASAVTVQDTGTRVFIGFNPAETKQLARTGVQGVFDHPAVRPYYYVSPDKDSYFKTVYVPGKGYYAYNMASRMIREAASHRNGRVWISFNKTMRKPLTIWTRW